MSPLLMTRDDALALSRAVGQVVKVTFGGAVPGSVTGTVVGVGLDGFVKIDVNPHGGFRIPMTDVTSWSPVESRKDSFLGNIGVTKAAHK